MAQTYNIRSKAYYQHNTYKAILSVSPQIDTVVNADSSSAHRSVSDATQPDQALPPSEKQPSYMLDTLSVSKQGRPRALTLHTVNNPKEFARPSVAVRRGYHSMRVS